MNILTNKIDTGIDINSVVCTKYFFLRSTTRYSSLFPLMAAVPKVIAINIDNPWRRR